MPDILKAGHTAVITGGASGIGLVMAKRFARAGMTVMIADVNEDALVSAKSDLEALSDLPVHTFACDVSDMDAVKAMSDAAFDALGQVNILVNNAGVARMGPTPWEGLDTLHDALNINLFGVIHGCHAFIPKMLESGVSGTIINTGSKQGITRPPGSYVYNLSKVGVLAYTESVAHALREIENCKLTAHLLVPGFVYTPMVEAFIPQKPPFAWTAEETVDYALPCIERGDFYVICPDNESPRAVDEKRMQWTADDIIKNRPALSRWHPNYKEAFTDFMKGN